MFVMNFRTSVVNVIIVIVCLVAHQASGRIFSNQFALHIPAGSDTADEIASKHDFTNLGEIFPDYYHFVHRKVAKRSIEPCHEYHERLSSEPEVRWHQQQKVKRRTKRDFLQLSANKQESKFQVPLGGGRGRTVKRSRVVTFNDPRWPAMWYLNRGPGLDMNVHEAWRDEGITGKGIVVTILDDGLEKDHPDIVRNYDPMASFDVNSLDMDPMPTYDLTDSNRHGTRCAGEVAAEANNSICAVGVAYEASVGGVRMLDGDVTDAVEARSLSHNPQHIDIYSASWGPDDDGKTVDGPGELATRAFIEGVTKGRGGKGSIFVWASGNGGRDHDNCNCDGYTNSIWTLSISSATENGLVPWYSEACSSTLATTYSSGGTGEKQVITIDLHHSCTSSHTGTSASAPLAAGICALALQANTNLTWRDMQHIVVRTARPQNLIAPDWATNGVGRNVSHSFGYGLMDAGAMVRLAKKWKTIPEQNKCEVKAPYSDKNIPAKSKVTLDLKVTNCTGVNFLEHVQAKVTLTSGRRGDLQIYLISPSGTRSTLLAHRRHDLSRSGFTDWPFMTVHCWGENPIGKWTLEIHNEGRYAGRTVLKRWSLIVYGTEEDGSTPSHNTPKAQNNNNNKPQSSPNPHNVPPSHFLSKISLDFFNKSTEGRPGSKIVGDSDSLFLFSGGMSNTSQFSGGVKNSVSSSSIESELVTTVTKKPSRQRGKGKGQTKAKKGPPPGSQAASQRPSTRIVTDNPEHLTSQRSKAGDDEHKLFLSSKFGNQSHINETTMSQPLIVAREFSPSSPTPFTSSSSFFSPSHNSSAAGVNSTTTTMTTTTTTTTAITTSTAVHEPGVKVGDGSFIGTPSSSNSTTGSSSSSQNQTDSPHPVPDEPQGKLQTWTLIAHGITADPNDATSPNSKGKDIVKGDPLSSSSVAGEPSLSSSVGGESGGGSEAIVDFGRENSIVSHVHSPSLGVDTAVAADVPVSTSSSSSSDCVKKSANGQCLDCSPEFALFQEQCLRDCPETFYKEIQGPAVFSAGIQKPSYECMPCHYSCKSCHGPHDFECTSCHSDANLHTVSKSLGLESSNESHCYPAVLLDTLNSNSFWYKTLLATLFLNVTLVTILIVYIWFQRRVPGEVKRSGHLLARRSYRRVSPDEDHPTALEVDVDLGSEDSEDDDDDSQRHLEQFTSQHSFVVKKPDLNSVHDLARSNHSSSNNKKVSTLPLSESETILPSMHSKTLPFS